MTDRKSTNITAAKLLKSLRHNPEFIRREQQDEQRRQELEGFFDAEERPLIQDLGQVGLKIKSVWDLVNSSQAYAQAIPVLLKHLKQPYHPKIKEGIIRALTVKEAVGVAAPPLVEAFRNITDPDTFVGQNLKWVIGNALSVVADEDVFESIVELVRDKRHGKARAMLPLALSNMKDERAVDVLDVLIELLFDDEVAGYAITALGNLKAKRAKPFIEKFLTSSEPWVRKEAKKALKKIENKISLSSPRG